MNVRIIPPRNLYYNKSGLNEFVLMTRPTPESIRRIKLKIKTHFKLNVPLSVIIRKLNPITRSWANYYRISSESMKVFNKLHGYILKLFFKWTRRNHPRKSKHWIVRNYIFTIQKHKWQIGVKNLNGLPIVLISPKTLPILKVNAVRTDINPYLDKDNYFPKRHKVHVIREFRRKVYIKHKYKCAACGGLLNDSERVELHRLLPGKDGGKYTLKNTVPLHKTCHESVTFAKEQWFRHLNIKK
jgi:RNA-directed DNA polymerase